MLDLFPPKLTSFVTYAKPQHFVVRVTGSIHQVADVSRKISALFSIAARGVVLIVQFTV